MNTYYLNDIQVYMNTYIYVYIYVDVCCYISL